MQARVYPGLLCDSIEFFRHDGSNRFFKDGKVRSFSELPVFYFEIIREYINNNPEINQALERMEVISEARKVEKLIECRYGGLDFNADIKDGVLQEGDYWDCPLRDLCPGEGKVCTPIKYNDQPVSSNEVKLIRMLVTDLTNEAIADKLCLALGTFHLFKKNLYAKLNITTKQELALIGVALNIL